MSTVMHILAILALIYAAGVSLGVMIIFAVQIGIEHGRRARDEDKINKP